MNEGHGNSAELDAENIAVELREDTATIAWETSLRPAAIRHLEPAQTSLVDDESLVWLNSVARFEKEKLKDYKLMVGELVKIRHLKNKNTWETWLNR